MREMIGKIACFAASIAEAATIHFAPTTIQANACVRFLCSGDAEFVLEQEEHLVMPIVTQS